MKSRVRMSVAMGVSLSSDLVIVLLKVVRLVAILRLRTMVTSHCRGCAAESVAKRSGAREAEPKKNGRGAGAGDEPGPGGFSMIVVLTAFLVNNGFCEWLRLHVW